MTVASVESSADRNTRRALQERIAGLGTPLDPDSQTYRTAVLLLTACEVGQGVDKLANVTGFPREFVARCARRLVDNGVWRDGATDAPWTTSDTEVTAFWADVGVAEGKLYRRVSADGGLEWGRPGQWWKEVHYVVSAGSYTPATRYYAPSLSSTPDDSPRQFLSRASEEPEVEEKPLPPARPVAPPAPPARATTPAPIAALPAVGEVVVVGSPDLFGGAVWLS